MGFRHALCLGLAVAGCGAQHTSTQMAGEGPEPAASTAIPASTPSTIAATAPSAAPTIAANGADAGSAIENTRSSAPKGPAAKVKPKHAEEASVTIATAKVHSDGRHYALDAKAPGGLAAGAHGELDVVLVAKDGYHINEEYPYKLKTASNPAGVVDFESPELARASGVYTATEARFVARFVASRAGSVKVGGTMSLSVCTKQECIVEKVELEVPVIVK